MIKLTVVVSILVCAIGGTLAVAADLPPPPQSGGGGNPFIKDAPPPPMQGAGAGMSSQQGQFLPPPSTLPDPIPQQFTENKSIFDSLAVVGLNDDYALLRYQASSGAAGAGEAPQSRVVGVTNGESIWLGGRRYLVKIADLTVRIITVQSKGKPRHAASMDDVVWAGDLNAPRGYSVSPNPQDLR